MQLFLREQKVVSQRTFDFFKPKIKQLETKMNNQKLTRQTRPNHAVKRTHVNSIALAQQSFVTTFLIEIASE